MPLPHFSNVSSHNKVWEPVFQNLFEVVVILPQLHRQFHKVTPLLPFLDMFKTLSRPNIFRFHFLVFR